MSSSSVQFSIDDINRTWKLNGMGPQKVYYGEIILACSGQRVLLLTREGAGADPGGVPGLL